MDLYNTLIKLIENISIEYIMQILLTIINCLPCVNFSARSATVNDMHIFVDKHCFPSNSNHVLNFVQNRSQMQCIVIIDFVEEN